MIFLLELKSLIRSRTLHVLTLVVIGWMLAVPHFVRGDGTEQGKREVVSYYSLAGALAITAVAVASAAAGSLSSERAAKRLQLTLARPVPYFSVAGGRIAALGLVAAVPLAFAMAISSFRDGASFCRHVYRPVMESPRSEAERMYKEYLADPAMSENIKKARKSSVLALLTHKAYDHYMAVPTNAVAKWAFDVPRSHAERKATVRVRFSDTLSLRRDVRGLISFGERTAPVTNITQAVVEFPLSDGSADAKYLEFANYSQSNLMLRPRRDIELLFDADSRELNHFRAWMVLVSMVVLVAAAGVFLGSCLSRPVAVWTIGSALFLSLASPAVVEQYPYTLQMEIGDAIGLALSRIVESVTRPLTAFSPVNAVAHDECVEWSDVAAAVGVNAVLLPVFLSFLSALAMRRKKL